MHRKKVQNAEVKSTAEMDVVALANLRGRARSFAIEHWQGRLLNYRVLQEMQHNTMQNARDDDLMQ